MQRYFLHGNLTNYFFEQEDIFHIQKVMKMRVGEHVEVVINSKAYEAKIETLNPFSISIINEITFDSEIENHVTLYYCLVKGDKLDFVIQKAVELGVKEIVLVQSKYCVTKYDKKEIKKKIERFCGIIKSACRQSHRLSIPNLSKIININDITKEMLNDINFIAYEKEAGGTQNTKKYFESISSKQSVSLLVGPEGGFSEEEVEKMNNIGFINVSLGKRILRSETAAISILSNLMFILESKI